MTIDIAQENLEKRAISRSAFKVMLGGIFSILAGFVNQMIIAAYFGAGADMDAYLTALVIPAYFQAVLLSGLSFVFIPAFVSEVTQGNEDTAWELAGTFFWITTGILMIIAIIGSIFAKEIISITAPGFGLKKSTLAAQMLSILMLSVPFAGLVSYTTGIQNARNSFFWPSFGGAINSIGNLITVILLARSLGAMALAWGFFTATLLQSCVTLIPVLRHGWGRLLPLSDDRLISMAKLILPFIVFGLLTRGTTLFERYFASVLPSGQISYLGYAAKISSIYQQLLATGIASAIFPIMARSYTLNGKDGLGEKTIYGLRLTLAVALPTVAITGALSVPLIRLLFERGEFHSMDTYYVAQVVLIALMSGVLSMMLGNILGRTFYVLKDTLTPPIISAISVLVYIGIGKFLANQWGYIGLAYALLIQQSIFIFVLFIFLYFKLPGIALEGTLQSAFTYSLGAIAAFFVAKLSLTNLTFLPDFLSLCISALVSGIFYLIVLYFHDREILIAVMEMLGVSRLMDLGRNMKYYLGHDRSS